MMSGTAPESEKSPEHTTTSAISLHQSRRSDDDGEKGEAANFDPEKHDSTTLSDLSGDDDDASTINNHPEEGGQSMSRTVSEVRDGIQNQRDLERGDDAIEKLPTVRPDDPNLVKWNGPDDPENPKNWLHSRKWAAVFCSTYK